VRLDPKHTPKGYELAQFQDAFARYVPSTVENSDLSATTPQPNSHAALPVADHPSQNSSATPSATPEPAIDIACGGVADRELVEEDTSASVRKSTTTPSHLRI
jgi:putative DNA primase/helicase